MKSVMITLSLLAFPATLLGLLTSQTTLDQARQALIQARLDARTIVVQAEATGIIEPINVVEVKSRSSGQVTEMPVETGTLVQPGGGGGRPPGR